MDNVRPDCSRRRQPTCHQAKAEVKGATKWRDPGSFWQDDNQVLPHSDWPHSWNPSNTASYCYTSTTFRPCASFQILTKYDLQKVVYINLSVFPELSAWVSFVLPCFYCPFLHWTKNPWIHAYIWLLSLMGNGRICINSCVKWLCSCQRSLSTAALIRCNGMKLFILFHLSLFKQHLDMSLALSLKERLT